jgi:hypothetical protein
MMEENKFAFVYSQFSIEKNIKVLNVNKNKYFVKTKLIQEGAFYLSYNNVEYYDVKLKQFLNIKNTYKFSNFIKEFEFIKGSTKLIQGRLSWADVFMIDIIKDIFKPKSFYIMLNKIPKIKGQLEEVRMRGHQYLIKQINTEIQTNKKEFTINIVDLLYDNYCWTEKIVINRNYITFNNNKNITIEDFLFESVDYYTSIDELEFKILLRSNIKYKVRSYEYDIFSVSINKENNYKENKIIYTPFGLTNILNFINSPVFTLIFLVFKIRFGCYRPITNKRKKQDKIERTKKYIYEKVLY